MSKKRKYPAADEKALILKRYLVEKVPMSDLCDEYDPQPSQIYRWQNHSWGQVQFLAASLNSAAIEIGL